MVAGYWLAVLPGLLCSRFAFFLVLFWVCFAVWEVGLPFVVGGLLMVVWWVYGFC